MTTWYAIIDETRRVVRFEGSDLPPIGLLVGQAGVAVLELPPLPLPEGWHYQLTEGLEFVLADPRTLAQAKADRIARMRDAREAAINGTFVWDGSTFDADQVSQARIHGSVTAAAAFPTLTFTWRLANNTWRGLSAVEMAQVFGSLMTHLQTKFDAFGAREAAINAATTNAAVDAVDWAAAP